ncbi:O-methyltransferase [Streptosporangium carneum]|uniref:Transferase n=1 Tax=Streptosporangium carneum TaxID=47481 RepID=A0A9W6HWR0_9ACTN|nr:class I SAM-dependent methyltransferase [Streptosporangium carneum]GLK07094.1 transferase [Streptosporangium carneum]
MAPNGTDAYDGLDVPPLVARAVELARRRGFPFSCRPEQGRLLQVLAGGARSSVAETGTGCGVGLAWLVTGARPRTDIVSVEREPDLARASAELFADVPGVTVICGDWSVIYDRAPYDLVVLDGGGHGKVGAPADPSRLLQPGGTLVVDDFTPALTWPPMHENEPDLARLHWLEHPLLDAVELRLAPDLAAVVAVRPPHGR